jgi:hypothetical protein
VGAWGALLDPTDVEGSRSELDLIPPQVHQFRRPQTVPISHEDHRAVAVTPTVSRSGFHQPLDLSLGEILAGAQVAIGRPSGGNCSILSICQTIISHDEYLQC